MSANKFTDEFKGDAVAQVGDRGYDRALALDGRGARFHQDRWPGRVPAR